ncbi:SURF1 family protein [Alphaproteobacteria bacterium LSUCC0684]
MTFRPALWMTVAAVPALLILLWLGTWQVMRMQWKDALIEEFTSRAMAEAITPPAAQEASSYQFQRIALSGTWMHDAETQLIGRTFEGTAGYHVITPMQLADGRLLLVNRGWVAEDYRKPSARPSTLTQGEVTMEAVLRLPVRKGRFVPDNAPSTDDWFTLSIEDIAAHHQLGETLITTYTADVLRPEGPYVLPIGAAVEIDIPNDHWHYAMTWYGLALGLVGVYASWHHQAGRLSFGRGQRGDAA